MRTMRLFIIRLRLSVFFRAVRVLSGEKYRIATHPRAWTRWRRFSHRLEQEQRMSRSFGSRCAAECSSSGTSPSAIRQENTAAASKFPRTLRRYRSSRDRRGCWIGSKTDSGERGQKREHGVVEGESSVYGG